MSAPGWYPDPQGEHQFRYWDGAAWTDHVHDEPATPPVATGVPTEPAAGVPTAPTVPGVPGVPPHGVGGLPAPARPAPDVRGGTHSGLAWIVALVIVIVVFAVAFVVATALTGDDDGDGSSMTVPQVGLPDGITIPDVTLPTGVTLPPGVTMPEVTLPAGVTLPDATVAPVSVPPVSVPPAGAPGETHAVVVTGAPLPPVAGDGSDPAVGMTAPQLVGASFDGSPVAIVPGAPTLVVFLAHWCPHCQAEVPRLVSWFQAGQVPAGVNVVGVATATTSDRDNFPPSAWLAGAGFPWPVLADSPVYDAAAAFGVDGFPYFVMYDAAGTVLFRASGEIEMEALTAQITTALG